MEISTARAEFENKIKELEVWAATSECTPKEINRILLIRFYKCVNEDIDEAKKVMKINYSLRQKSPKIFLNRDPNDEDSKNTFAYSDMIVLPGLTPDKYKVTLYRYRDTDPSKVHHLEDTKAFMMFSDCRFVYSDLENETDYIADGEIQIFDMKGCTVRHITKLKMNILRIYMNFLQKALPIVLKEIHMINCPASLNKMIAIVKPFISKKVFDMIYFNCENSDTLYKVVPIAMMPNEYGGNAGTLADLRAKEMQKLTEQRDYLMDYKQWNISSECSSTSVVN